MGSNLRFWQTNSSPERFASFMASRIEKERIRYNYLGRTLRDTRKSLVAAGIAIPSDGGGGRDGPMTFAEIDRGFRRRRSLSNGSRRLADEPVVADPPSKSRLKRWRADLEPGPPSTRASAGSEALSPPDRSGDSEGVDISPARRKRQREWAREQETQRKRLRERDTQG
jgi:hypothetical protein